MSRLFATPWPVAYRLFHPWDFPGKNTGMGCHFLLQEIFPTQGLNPGLLHLQVVSFLLPLLSAQWPRGDCQSTWAELPPTPPPPLRGSVPLVVLDFPGGSDSKASVYNAGDQGSIPGLGRSPGEGNGNPLQDYCLENPMHRGAYSPWSCKESDTTE